MANDKQPQNGEDLPCEMCLGSAHMASRSGHVDCLSRVLTMLPSEKLLDTSGQTPMHSAAYNGQIDTLKYLIESTRIPIRAKSSEGNTCAHAAAQARQLECLKLVLSGPLPQAQSLAFEQNKLGNTVLHLAVQANDNPSAQWLLQRFGKDISNLPNKNHILPLHIAAAKGNIEFLRLVTKYDVYMANKRDKNGATPLFYAVQGGHLQCVRYLVDKARADIHLVTKQGQSVLHAACLHGHPLLVQWLINRMDKPFIYHQTHDNATPVHCAAYSGHLGILKLLHKTSGSKKYLVGTGDRRGNTPLHLVAMHNHQHAARFLLEVGADAKTKNKAGLNAVTLADKHGHRQMAALLMASLNGPKELKRYIKDSGFYSFAPEKKRPLSMATSGYGSLATPKSNNTLAMPASPGTHSFYPDVASSGYASSTDNMHTFIHKTESGKDLVSWDERQWTDADSSLILTTKDNWLLRKDSDTFGNNQPKTKTLSLIDLTGVPHPETIMKKNLNGIDVAIQTDPDYLMDNMFIVDDNDCILWSSISNELPPEEYFGNRQSYPRETFPGETAIPIVRQSHRIIHRELPVDYPMDIDDLPAPNLHTKYQHNEIKVKQQPAKRPSKEKKATSLTRTNNDISNCQNISNGVLAAAMPISDVNGATPSDSANNADAGIRAAEHIDRALEGEFTDPNPLILCPEHNLEHSSSGGRINGPAVNLPVLYNPPSFDSEDDPSRNTSFTQHPISSKQYLTLNKTEDNISEMSTSQLTTDDNTIQDTSSRNDIVNNSYYSSSTLNQGFQSGSTLNVSLPQVQDLTVETVQIHSISPWDDSNLTPRATPVSPGLVNKTSVSPPLYYDPEFPGLKKERTNYKRRESGVERPVSLMSDRSVQSGKSISLSDLSYPGTSPLDSRVESPDTFKSVSLNDLGDLQSTPESSYYGREAWNDSVKETISDDSPSMSNLRKNNPGLGQNNVGGCARQIIQRRKLASPELKLKGMSSEDLQLCGSRVRDVLKQIQGVAGSEIVNKSVRNDHSSFNEEEPSQVRYFGTSHGSDEDLRTSLIKYNTSESPGLIETRSKSSSMTNLVNPPDLLSKSSNHVLNCALSSSNNQLTGVVDDELRNKMLMRRVFWQDEIDENKERRTKF